ncbi:MAG: response regulator [Planctomycetes bacterium]|nr:response regulator [Planctomycetota bacterium]MCH8068652.1 response regulator [Candidatus Neomarinimicrobiota bacterium]
MENRQVEDKSIYKILVVDYKEDNVELLEARLSPKGYAIEKAYDGEEALKKLEENSPDLILLDIMMPKVNGYEVCKKLKTDEKTQFIPIVMITVLKEMEDKIKSIEAGADDFISKPFSKYKVIARSRSLLKMRHFTDELEHAETVIGSLALSVESKDPYTEGHCARLSMYSAISGRKWA